MQFQNTIFKRMLLKTCPVGVVSKYDFQILLKIQGQKSKYSLLPVFEICLLYVCIINKKVKIIFHTVSGIQYLESMHLKIGMSSELSGAIAKRLPHAKNQLSAPGSFFNQFVTEREIYTQTLIEF